MNKYEIILDLYQTKNISKTSEKMNYSPSAVSQTISNYEQELGMQLFTRTNRGLRPRQDAEPVFQEIRRIFLCEQQLLQTVSELSNLNSGDLRIGTIQCISYNWLPDILKLFSASYPNIHFTLFIEGYQKLATLYSEGKLDCVFTTEYAAPTGSFLPLWKDEYMLVMPRDHRLSSLHTIPLSELNQENLILTADKLSYETGLLLKQHNIKPNIRFQLNDDFAVLNMVEKGFGVAIMQNLLLNKMPFDVCIRPFTGHYYNMLGLAYHDVTFQTAPMRKFLNSVSEWNSLNKKIP